MANLFRNLSMSRSSSSSSTSPLDSSTKQVVSIKNIETHLQNWSIPKTPSSQIYNKGSFLFKSDYIIKTVEQSLPITQGHMTVEMLPKNKPKKNGRKYTAKPKTLPPILPFQTCKISK